MHSGGAAIMSGSDSKLRARVICACLGNVDWDTSFVSFYITVPEVGRRGFGMLYQYISLLITKFIFLLLCIRNSVYHYGPAMTDV